MTETENSRTTTTSAKKPKKKLTLEERAAKADKDIARAKEQIAKANEVRKNIQRRKEIVVGELLLKSAGEEGKFGQILKALVARIQDADDRALFNGFAYAEPGTSPAPSSPAPALAPAQTAVSTIPFRLPDNLPTP